MVDCLRRPWKTVRGVFLPPELEMRLNQWPSTTLNPSPDKDVVEFDLYFHGKWDAIRASPKIVRLQVFDRRSGMLVFSTPLSVEFSRCLIASEDARYCYDAAVRNFVIIFVSVILLAVFCSVAIVVLVLIGRKIWLRRHADLQIFPEKATATASSRPIRLRVFWNRVLGEGAFSRVYEGSMPTPDGGERTVAVKIFRKEATAQIPNITRLMELQHPNVIRCFGGVWGEGLDERYLLAIELCNMDLRSYLRRNRKSLTALERLDLMLQCARGMEYLHRCNISHRDVKPENCLLVLSRGSGAVLKIADFGCATSRSRVTVDEDGHPLKLIGTPGYIAPFGHYLPPSERKEELVALEMGGEWSVWNGKASDGTSSTILSASILERDAMLYGDKASSSGSPSLSSLEAEDGSDEDEGENAVVISRDSKDSNASLRKRLFSAPVSSTLFCNDVYAFGVLAWEVWTSEVAFESLRENHRDDLDKFFWVCHGQHRRPIWPREAPPALKDLACECWDPVPKERPQFSEIVKRLDAIKADLPGEVSRESDGGLSMLDDDRRAEDEDEAHPLLASHPSIN